MSTLSTTNVKNPSSGSNNIVLAADGSTTITTLTGTTITGTSVRGGITSSTAVASTSGLLIDFLSIPSYVKRITVMLDGVSLSGTSHLIVQIGDSGGIETTSYKAQSTVTNTGSATVNSVQGFILISTQAAFVYYGNLTINNLSGNTWTASGTTALIGGTSDSTTMSGGSKTLSATLDRIRIATENGTDTFDAGSINILYEG
jgi:hypothetical protein